MTPLIFMTGIFQDDLDDGLCGNVYSLRAVSEQDFSVFIPPVDVSPPPSPKQNPR